MSSARILLLSCLFACSDETTDNLPPTLVTFPGSFPVQGTTTPGFAVWYRVSGVTMESRYTVTVTPSTMNPDHVSMHVSKDKNEFGPANELCMGTMTTTGEACTFTAHAGIVDIAVLNKFQMDALAFTLNLSAAP